MPRLPDAYGSREVPNTQRRVWSPNASQMAASQAKTADALQSAAGELKDTADIMKKEQSKDALLDAMKRENEMQQKVNTMLYGDENTPGIYSRQGEDALRSADDFRKEFASLKSSYMNGVTDKSAMAALNKSFMDMETNTLGNIQQNVMGKRQKYASDLLDSRDALAKQRIGTEAVNDKVFEDGLKDITESAISKNKINGFVPGTDTWNLSIDSAVKSAYATRAKQLLSSDNAEARSKGLSFYEKNRANGMFAINDIAELDGISEKIGKEMAAVDAFNQSLAKSGISEKYDQGKVFSRMLIQESGNSHFDKDGNVITSPAGAKGIAQLMEPTAREVLKEMGQDPDMWQRGPQNRAAGEYYFNKLAKKYNGNTTLAVMAYNAGPGAVDDFINGTNKTGKNSSGIKLGDPNKGEISSDGFIARFPFSETRKYAMNVLGINKADRGRIDEEYAKGVAATMEEETAKQYMSYVKNHNTAIEVKVKQDRNSVINDAMSYRDKGGISALPVTLKQKAEDLGIMRDIELYDGKTDPVTAAWLYSLDAKTLSETDIEDPQIRLKLSPEDYDKWTDKKSKLSTNENAYLEIRRKSLVNEAFERREISYKKDGDAKKVIRSNELIDIQIDAYTKMNGGRYPNEAELTRIIDNVFMDKNYDANPGTNFWPGNWGGGAKYMFDIDVDNISKNDRKYIEDLLKSQGRTVTDSAIVEAFATLQANGSDKIGK